MLHNIPVDSKHQILIPSDKERHILIFQQRDLMPHYIKCKLANNAHNMDNPLNGLRVSVCVRACARTHECVSVWSSEKTHTVSHGYLLLGQEYSHISYNTLTAYLEIITGLHAGVTNNAGILSAFYPISPNSDILQNYIVQYYSQDSDTDTLHDLILISQVLHVPLCVCVCILSHV